MAQRTPSPPPVLPGFTFVRPLGSGGFADVFLYEQDTPRRSVAVKVHPRPVTDPEQLRMFRTEADILARLSAHPSIVTVHQAGISADGRPYIVMEYCTGSYSPRYRTERIPVAEALMLGVKLAGALETAHRAGLVHRDVKPGNILTTSFGIPQLADFGIAASLSATSPVDFHALSVPWSAPEVVSERSTGGVASEVWSLGATVYSLLAGRSPFEEGEREKNTRDQLRRRIERARYTPIARDDVPASLQRVLATAMSADPAARHPSAAALGETLRVVEAELGLPRTPMEIAREDWAPPTGNAPTPGGPVRVEVPQQSARKAPEPRSGSRDDGIVQPGGRRRLAVGWLIAAAAVLLVAGAAVGILIAGGR